MDHDISPCHTTNSYVAFTCACLFPFERRKKPNPSKFIEVYRVWSVLWFILRNRENYRVPKDVIVRFDCMWFLHVQLKMRKLCTQQGNISEHQNILTFLSFSYRLFFFFSFFLSFFALQFRIDEEKKWLILMNNSCLFSKASERQRERERTVHVKMLWVWMPPTVPLKIFRKSI